MNIIKSFQNLIFELDKKEIFLIGFYVSFLFVMTVAGILDFVIGNYDDAYIEVVFVILTLISFGYYRYSKNIEISVYSIVILATLTTYALLISNEFNISVFHSIVPLGYFLLFSLKRSLFYTLIHQMIVVSIYIYGHFHYPDSEMLHNSAVLTATAMASLMIVLFGVFYHIAVENTYQKLAVSNRQKEILLKEVHHRVKNNLNIISSMLGLQMMGEKGTELEQIIQKNRLRIDSIAMVHELLYKHNNFEKINIYEYLQNLSQMIVEVVENDVKVVVEKYDLFLPFEDILKIGIISNELMTNSIKHAFDSKGGQMWISFDETEEGYVYNYRDNGEKQVVIEDVIMGNSLGVKLIHMMVEQMEAKLTMNDSKGLSYEIRIPR